MDPLQLKVYIYMFFMDLNREQNVTLPDIPLEFSDNVLGTLNISDILITGFETLTNDITNLNATEDENNNNNLCVHLPIGNLKLTLNYGADIGIDDEIPIYGDGQLEFSMSEIQFTTCMFINFNEGYIGDVYAEILYRHAPMTFTGFWRNDEVSLILENLLNIANRLYAMWSAYEPDRASCVLTPVVSYLLNRWFGNENARFEFDETCLEGIIFEDSDEKSNTTEEMMFKKIMNFLEYDDNNDELKIFVEENESVILPIMKHLSKTVAKLL